MDVDTHGLTSAHLDKRLRVELASGEVMEIQLHELTVCGKPEPCCGVTYTLLLTNRGGKEREKNCVYWTGFPEIKCFQILGD
jgi:hypothetical protein